MRPQSMKLKAIWVLFVASLFVAHSEAKQLLPTQNAVSASSLQNFQLKPLESHSNVPAKCPYTYLPRAIPPGVGLEPLLQNFSKLFDSQFQTTKVAATAELTYMGKTIWSWNGGMDNRTKMKPTVSSPYRIGSITKVFPWLLALVAEGQGLIHMDEPVTKTVPELKMVDKFHSESSGLQNSYTWSHLASHMAGMPREPPCDFFNCSHTTDEMLERLLSIYLVLPPGTLPAYSNLGFALLGRLLADKVFARANPGIKPLSFEQLVHKFILNPLGMSNTGFEAPTNLVPPYPHVPLTDMMWSAPAGNMYSTAEDLSKLLVFFNNAASTRFLFANLPFSLRRSESSPFDSDMNELGFANYRLRDSFFPRYRNPDFTGFGTPWEFTNGDQLYYIRNKAGNIDGYSSDIALIPEISLGLTLLTNFGTSGNDWATMNLNTFLPGFMDILRPLQGFPLGPPNPSRYVGTYSGSTEITTDILGILKISKIDGNFVSIPLVANSWDPNDASVLQVYVPEASLGCMSFEFLNFAYKVVIFKLDPNGNVLSFALQGNGGPINQQYTKL